MAVQLQAGDTFEDDSMQILPVLTGRLKQTPNLIEDESYSGDAFKDVPQKGTVSISGDVDLQLDSLSIRTLLEATMGNVESLTPGKRYVISSHAKKLSICIYDGVKNSRYANVYIKSLKISGSSSSKFTCSVSFVGITAEDRADASTFPANPDNHEDFMHFHEMQGEGYFRVGDTVDALGASDDFCIDSFEVTINTGFDEQFANCSRYSLTPLFGMSRPSVEGSFKLARYSDDSFLQWRDDLTRLQLEFRIYKSTSSSLLGQIPMFIIDSELTDDDVTGQQISMTIGRNGVGTSYKNNNMAFTSPLRLTVIDE